MFSHLEDTNVKILPNITFKKFFSKLRPQIFIPYYKMPALRSLGKILQHETQNKNKHRPGKITLMKTNNPTPLRCPPSLNLCLIFHRLFILFAALVTCYLFILKERKRFFNFFFFFNFSILFLFFPARRTP